MIVFKRMGAMATFYYLMAVDGDISGDELSKLDEIGAEIDPENYINYKDALIAECNAQIDNTIDEEDYYDVVSEGVDAALSLREEGIGSGVTSRMLVWDLLIISFVDGQYQESERRLIKHIVRTFGIDKSVFLEMEQMIKASIAVHQELEWIKQSDKPYSEIAPIVAELENRVRVISESAQCLIKDEVLNEGMEAVVVKDDFIDKAKIKASAAMAPVAEKINNVAAPVMGKAGETAAPVVKEVGARAEKLASGAKGLLKSGIKSLKKGE